MAASDDQAGSTPAASARTGSARAGAPGPRAALSPSRAGDFMTCPLLYRFRVVDRLPEPPSPAAARGTVVHHVLERLFDHPADERTLQTATGLLPASWQAVLDGDAELASSFSDDVDGSRAAEWLAGSEDLLATYFRLEDPTRLEPAERELYVEAPLSSGLTLRGYVDRLDVAPDGALRVVDYKTGKSPKDGFEQRALFQMRFYALALWRTRGVVPRLLQLVYLGNADVVRYQPDESDLLAMERKLEALWAAIERAHDSGDWRPSPSRLCDWCAHRAVCPAWGGTPPPLPRAEDGVPTSQDEVPSAHASAVDL